ncbi:MAG: hypothetical protein COA94_08910 [Rickettsiales bacterium]|nr:MAG: hypothetical protein COA94_08910 [Rickettsiales bacterium]
MITRRGAISPKKLKPEVIENFPPEMPTATVGGGSMNHIKIVPDKAILPFNGLNQNYKKDE